MSQALRQHIESVVPLSDEEFEQILPYFTPRYFQKHQFLVQEGYPVHQDYFLLSGLTKSYHLDELGREHIVQFGMEQCWITDLQAYHGQAPASLNVYCLENTQVLSLSYSNMELLCASLSKMQHYFRKKAVAETTLLQRRILCLISNNAADRYNDLLLQYPSLIQRVPKSMLASYLGVSRETLSRML